MKNNKWIHFMWAGIAVVLSCIAAIFSWGCAWGKQGQVILGLKQEVSTLRTDTIRDQDARLQVVEKSYNTLNSDMTNYNKKIDTNYGLLKESIDKLEIRNAADHKEIKDSLRSNGMSMVLEPKGKL